MSERVLLVEDEERMRHLIRVYLNKHGVYVAEVPNGEIALNKLEEESFDVIILDIMMPIMDGFAFLQKYSKRTPVIVLSAKVQIEDKLAGFKLGIDDYLTKPFDLRELLARIQALAKRFKPAKEIETHQGLILDHESKTLRVDGMGILLTPKEFEILEMLSTHPKRVFTRVELLNRLWESTFDIDDRIVDSHVKNIRDKCKDNGCDMNPILTVWGMGYRYGGS